MLGASLSPNAKRENLKQCLAQGDLLRFPGAFSPLIATLISRIGFEGVYVSGAVLSADLSLPDVGLTTLTEVAQRAHAIARTTDLPTIADIDTGFGEPLNVARSVRMLEDLGLAGCHLEDQRNPKRCGHLDHKQLVPLEEMEKKVRAAVTARRDPNFLVIARSDARALEGIDGLINRCKRYVDAGADAIFPEALISEREFERVRQALAVPLIANMTEFGKSELLSTETLRNLGYNIVLYPVTSLRLALFAVERGLQSLSENGTQTHLIAQMQTRNDLYELLSYQRYETFDADIFNFASKNASTPGPSS